MKKLMNKKDGFTLIELMIVVVIIGILAAVAIPQFLKYQLKSKTTEATRSLGAIKTNQEAFAARWNQFGLVIAVPAGDPGSVAQAWEITTSNEGFDLLGFAPTGNVYYQYGVNTWAMPALTGDTCAIVTNATDVSLGAGTGGNMVGVTNGVTRIAGTNRILMWAKGDLDGDTNFGCFAMGNESSEIIPSPAAAGDAIF